MSRAFVQAYQQAAANPNAAKNAAKNAQRTLKNKMSVEEGLKVLNFERQPKSLEEVNQQFTRFFNANDPSKGGSFYLQSKFYRAKEVVEEQLKEEAAEGAKEVVEEQLKEEAAEGAKKSENK
eukprot:CAMPEP_0203805280 /NCGR_PEP_ID=MMETSP0100_2-20121128/14126_1 /ASSEMBLY_ACC=CAM_ASM_000210 /TAXON_ID=96639 /ORGANISM=" , Strain NY0313808BC1" /LENGTH=121 /DNA_ID=CAMNT_0050713739 /DNA_START=132 /DNA_END=497 /DNA_ORIENTATION=+